MKVNIKCYANLSKDRGCNYRQPISPEVSDHSQVRGALSQVGVDANAVHLVYVNGRQAGLDDTLREGDRVGLFPAVAGM
jgi:molybdopterin converting factor small subunit